MQKKGMELEGLVKSGDVVLAGVSGGADSVCLLLMLLEYRKHCDFFLEAVHVEHGIRAARPFGVPARSARPSCCAT